MVNLLYCVSDFFALKSACVFLSLCNTHHSNRQVLINVSSDQWPFSYHYTPQIFVLKFNWRTCIIFDSKFDLLFHIKYVVNFLSYCPSIEKVSNGFVWGVLSNWWPFPELYSEYILSNHSSSQWKSIRQAGVLLLQLCEGELALFELVGEAVLNNRVRHLQHVQRISNEFSFANSPRARALCMDDFYGINCIHKNSKKDIATGTFEVLT